MRLGLGLDLECVLLRGAAGISPPSTDILIVAGEANAVTQEVFGADDLPAGWVDTSSVQIWNGSAFETYSPGAAPNWGPEVGYALAWLADHPGKTLYIVKNAANGAQLGAIETYGIVTLGNGVDWSQAPSTTASLYPDLKAAVQAAEATLTGPFAVKVLLLEGEMDSTLLATAEDWGANATALYTAMRADFGDANAMILTASVSDPRYWEFKDAVIQAQIALANSNARNRAVSANNLACQAGSGDLTAGSINTLGAALYASIAGGSTINFLNRFSSIDYNTASNITIDATGLIATRNNFFNGASIARRGAWTGKKYFAATAGGVGDNTAVGFASETVTPGGAWLGAGNNSIGINSTGNVYLGGSPITTLAPFSGGDLAELAVDIDAKLVWRRINGGNWNDSPTANPATGAGGIDVSGLTFTVLFPAISMNGTVGDTVTLDNGRTPPSGFTYYGAP